MSYNWILVITDKFGANEYHGPFDTEDAALDHLDSVDGDDVKEFEAKQLLTPQ